MSTDNRKNSHYRSRSTKKSSSELQTTPKRSPAIDVNLWEGQNVIMSKALVNSIHGLDLNGKRAVGLAMSQIGGNTGMTLDANQCWCVDIQAQDFSKVFDVELNEAYRQMQRGVSELLGAVVSLRSRDNVTNQIKIEKMPWMQHIEYLEGQGKVKLKFNLLLTPHISRLVAESGGGYALYKITQAGRLRSAYAWRLFELFSQFRDTGWMSIGIDDLHERLDTSPSMRKNFGQFKLYCLNVMIQELRDKCKIDVTYEPTKEGRRFTKIKFKFRDDQEFVLAKRVEALRALVTPTAMAAEHLINGKSIWHADNLQYNPLAKQYIQEDDLEETLEAPVQEPDPFDDIEF
jgi:plasmid replication initiation protein